MDDAQFQRWLAELAADRSHGAAELARQCLDCVARSAISAEAANLPQLREKLHQRCRSMISARPSMAPIACLLDHWQRSLTAITVDELSAVRKCAAQLAENLALKSSQATICAAAHAAEIIGDGKTLLTHSFSSTILALFSALRTRGVAAIVTESRPLNEGHATAARLSQLGIPATLITEAQIGLSIAEADAVVVGADGILPDGSIVNKVGTFLLALATQDQGKPFYVCTESFKRWPPWMTHQTLKLEEMSPEELGAPQWNGVKKRNVYFDITPARLITRCITEEDNAA